MIRILCSKLPLWSCEFIRKTFVYIRQNLLHFQHFHDILKIQFCIKRIRNWKRFFGWHFVYLWKYFNRINKSDKSKTTIVFISVRNIPDSNYMERALFLSILDSIVVSIPACHAGDRGSIPRRGGFFFFFTFSNILLLTSNCNNFGAKFQTSKQNTFF